MNIPQWSSLIQKIIVELNTPQHSSIICIHSKTISPESLIQLSYNQNVCISELTYRRIRSQWFVVKAENLSKVIKIGVLNNQIPLRVIHPVVEICNGDLHTPVFLVIKLHMPMNSNRAHMFSALNQRC